MLCETLIAKKKFCKNFITIHKEKSLKSVEVMEEGGTASNVARAIVAVLDWNSSPDTRKAAVSFLESVLPLSVFLLCYTQLLFQFNNL